MSSQLDEKKKTVKQLYVKLLEITASINECRKEFIVRLKRVVAYTILFLVFTIYFLISGIANTVLFFILSLMFSIIISFLIRVLLVSQLELYRKLIEEGDHYLTQLSNTLDWELYRHSLLYNDINTRYKEVIYNYYKETRGDKSLNNRKYTLILHLLNVIIIVIFVISVYLFFRGLHNTI